MSKPLPIPDFCKASHVLTWKPSDIRRVEEKDDGHRLLAIRRPGTVEVRTRTIGINKWPELAANFPEMKKLLLEMPLGTAVDMEAHAPGVPATSVPTLLKNGDSRLRFTAFAMPVYDYRPMVYTDFEVMSGLLSKMGFSLPTELHPSVIRDRTVEEASEFLKSLAKERRIEGFVVKRHPYNGWWKVKPTKSVDAVVMDTTVSDSDTHYGTLKALQVGVYFGEELQKIASVGSGFDQEYRHSLDTEEKRASLVGRVCEVEYDSLAANGALKFPRFVRWRDDEKRPEDCTSEQDKEWASCRT